MRYVSSAFAQTSSRSTNSVTVVSRLLDEPFRRVGFHLVAAFSTLPKPRTGTRPIPERHRGAEPDFTHITDIDRLVAAVQPVRLSFARARRDFWRAGRPRFDEFSRAISAN